MSVIIGETKVVDVCGGGWFVKDTCDTSVAVDQSGCC